jgi:hypothetical protein
MRRKDSGRVTDVDEKQRGLLCCVDVRPAEGVQMRTDSIKRGEV